MRRLDNIPHLQYKPNHKVSSAANQIVRDFTRCPRCGAATTPSKSWIGTQSEFWYECTKCNTYINTYIPQDHQAAVHKDKHTFVGNFGGYGSGKTTTDRQEFYKHMFITPHGNTLIGANVSSQYEQTIKRDIEADLPAAFFEDYSVQKAYYDFKNGHRLMFRPLDDQGKLRSYNLSMFIVVEASEVDAEIFAQLKTRLRNTAASRQKIVDGVPQFRTTKNGGQVPIWEHSWQKGLIESNPDSGWIRSDVLLVSSDIQKHGDVKDKYAIDKADLDPATSSHITATDANEYLPPDPITFIQNICKNKPDWWVRRYTQGSFSYAEGLVYPNAMNCIVDSFEIPKTWVRLIAFDYGLSDDARYLFGAIDMQKGILYVYKELSANNKNIEQLAQLYYQGAEDIPSGMLYGQPIIDPKSGPKRDYNKKSLSDYFLDYGIAFKPGVVSLDARIFRLNTYIDQGYVKIFRDCRLLIKELSDYKYPPHTLGEARHSDKPIDKNNHSINPLEWIVMELPANPKNILQGVYNKRGQRVDLDEEALDSPLVPWQLADTEDTLTSDPYDDADFNYGGIFE